MSKALGEVVWDWDFGTGLIEARGAAQAFGIDCDLIEKAYAWFEERVHPADRQGVNDKLGAALSGPGDRWCAEYRFRHEDGSYRWFWDRGLIVRNRDGTASRMIGCMTDVTSRKAAIQQLCDSERRLQALVTATSSFICRFDPAGQIVAGEEDWVAFTGAEYKGCSNEETLSLLHPDDREAYARTKTAAWEIGAEYSAEVRLLHVDGTYRWLAITGVPVRDEGRIVEWVLLFVDVHEAREAERRQDSLTAELAERVKELRSLHAATIACNQDDLPAETILKNIAFLLPAALLRPHFGLCAIEWLGRRFASDDDLLPGALVREKLLCRGNDVGFIELGYGSGRRLDLSPEERQLLRTVASLISQMLSRRADREDIEAQRQQNWMMAHHDALTGLPNRRLFQQKLEEAVSTTLDQSSRAALILIDLDHFKDVNDLLGHDAGDVLLASVAQRVSAAVGDRGLVARIGGDEFAVLLPNVSDVSECAHIARCIVAALHPPIAIEGQPVSARATLGTAAAPVDGSTAAELLKAADIALYTGKARGRDDLVAFSSSMRTALEERARVCASVRASLSDDHFVPYYQPQICLESGRVFGFEALIRWLHPDEGLKGPATMLPAFEDAELALKLGDRLLTHVIRDLSAWRAGGFQPGHVSLNLCSAEFKRPNLAGHIISRLEAAGIPTECIAVEVTETVLLGREADAVARTLEELHQAGIKIALDDFGTGYASLTHLKQFPVDIIKIDQSFVRSMPTDPECHAIVETINDLGRRLGKTVIAEGVEAEEHASMLSQAGCKLAQGFLFAKPMPASRVPYLLTGAERQHWTVEANRRKKVKAA